jgi:thiol-disulfide isomerase/thioredoxin
MLTALPLTDTENFMAAESQMLPLGTPAPMFTLPDPGGIQYSLIDSADAYLIMFICNHCPYVKHVREELAHLGSEYSEKNVAIYAINSNDADSYPGDSPENMKKEAAEWNYTFPYLTDGDQSVAKAYRAACTPDFYVFDTNRILVYRGQLDASRPSNNEPVDGKDIRTALDNVLAGQPVSDQQIASIGCSIKWKPGNQPA